MNMQVKHWSVFRGLKKTLINQGVDFFFFLLFACVCLVIDTMWYIQLFGVHPPKPKYISGWIPFPFVVWILFRQQIRWRLFAFVLTCCRLTDWTWTQHYFFTPAPSSGEVFILKFWSPVVFRGGFNAPLCLFDSRGRNQMEDEAAMAAVALTQDRCGILCELIWQYCC